MQPVKEKIIISNENSNQENNKNLDLVWAQTSQTIKSLFQMSTEEKETPVKQHEETINIAINLLKKLIQTKQTFKKLHRVADRCQSLVEEYFSTNESTKNRSKETIAKNLLETTQVLKKHLDNNREDMKSSEDIAVEKISFSITQTHDEVSYYNDRMNEFHLSIVKAISEKNEPKTALEIYQKLSEEAKKIIYSPESQKIFDNASNQLSILKKMISCYETTEVHLEHAEIISNHNKLPLEVVVQQINERKEIYEQLKIKHDGLAQQLIIFLQTKEKISWELLKLGFSCGITQETEKLNGCLVILFDKLENLKKSIAETEKNKQSSEKEKELKEHQKILEEYNQEYQKLKIFLNDINSTQKIADLEDIVNPSFTNTQILYRGKLCITCLSKEKQNNCSQLIEQTKKIIFYNKTQEQFLDRELGELKEGLLIEKNGLESTLTILLQKIEMRIAENGIKINSIPHQLKICQEGINNEGVFSVEEEIDENLQISKSNTEEIQETVKSDEALLIEKTMQDTINNQKKLANCNEKMDQFLLSITNTISIQKKPKQALEDYQKLFSENLTNTNEFKKIGSDTLLQLKNIEEMIVNYNKTAVSLENAKSIALHTKKPLETVMEEIKERKEAFEKLKVKHDELMEMLIIFKQTEQKITWRLSEAGLRFGIIRETELSNKRLMTLLSEIEIFKESIRELGRKSNTEEKTKALEGHQKTLDQLKNRFKEIKRSLSNSKNPTKFEDVLDSSFVSGDILSRGELCLTQLEEVKKNNCIELLKSKEEAIFYDESIKNKLTLSLSSLMEEFQIEKRDLEIKLQTLRGKIDEFIDEKSWNKKSIPHQLERCQAGIDNKGVFPNDTIHSLTSGSSGIFSWFSKKSPENNENK